MNNIIFKTLLLKGEAGQSIESIAKTSTSGLVDTYTITLTDGSTTTFEVTNGSGIDNIAKTSTSGLVDTYTITYTNGTTSTFEVNNGNGIANIAKTSTSGAVDTYTITYTNGTTSTFTVTNSWIDNSEATTTTGQLETVTGGKLSSCIVELTPVQSGSGDPSPTNIRPITGHTEAKVVRTGENMLDTSTITKSNITFTEDNEGYISATPNNSDPRVWTYANAQYNAFLPAGQYNLVVDVKTLIESTSAQIRLIKPDEVTIIENATALQTQGVTIIPFSISTPTSLGIMVKFYTGVAKLAIVDRAKTNWSAYQGKTVTVDLDGTRYGGTLDVISGVLTVDKAIIDLGTLAWNNASVGGSTNSTTAITNAVNPPRNYEKADMDCNKYLFLPYYVNGQLGVDANSTPNSIAIFASGGNTIFIYDPSLANMTGAQVATALEGVQVLYNLATPITVQLTPEEITTLVGVNNLLAPLDGQEITEAKYRPVYTYEELTDDLVEKTGVWSNSVTGAIDAISVTITNSNILTSSIIEVYSSNASGTPIGLNKVEVTAGQAVVKFDALTEATSFKLRILNL